MLVGVCVCGCPIGVLDSSVAFSATMALIYKQKHLIIIARFVKWFCQSCSGASTHAHVVYTLVVISNGASRASRPHAWRRAAWGQLAIVGKPLWASPGMPAMPALLGACPALEHTGPGCKIPPLLFSATMVLVYNQTKLYWLVV